MKARASKQNLAETVEKASNTHKTDVVKGGTDAQWEFRLEGSDNSGVDATASSTTTKPKQSVAPVTWTASEFIAHQKSFIWYLALALAGAALASTTYLVTRDKISTAVIIVAAFVLGFYGARKPRVLEYQLDESGLAISGKSYAFNLFKSFALVDEGALNSIVLMPLKRFMPAISIYFEPKDEKKITTILAERLPVENHKLDALDSLMRRIRF